MISTRSNQSRENTRSVINYKQRKTRGSSMRPSTIQWTDYTMNFWTGCSKVSAGCRNCYMYRDSARWGKDAQTVRRTGDSTFYRALRLREPQRLFTCSYSDFFHEGADAWRADAWSVIRATPQHSWQILTKRPHNILDRLPDDWGAGYENVWLGVSAENQSALEERVPILKSIPAKLRFLSLEPLLSPVVMTVAHKVDWVIVGGESGNDTGQYGYRPCEMEWIEQVISDCRKLEMQCFVKQLGTHLYKELDLTNRHGADIENWPDHLRIREFPEGDGTNCESDLIPLTLGTTGRIK